MKNKKQPERKLKEERSKYWAELVEILEEQFPKGKSKERGGALVLLAHAEIALKEQAQEIRKEIKEKTDKITNHNEMLEMEGKEFTRGFNQCLEEIKEIIL